MDYYNRQGQPVTRDEWVSDFESDRRVAEDTIGRYWISTVHLGLNHNWREGPPLIFETMVFDQQPGSEDSDVWCERYSTEEEALAGHQKVVEELTAGTFTDYVGKPLDSTYEITEEPTLI